MVQAVHGRGNSYKPPAQPAFAFLFSNLEIEARRASAGMSDTSGRDLTASANSATDCLVSPGTIVVTEGHEGRIKDCVSLETEKDLIVTSATSGDFRGLSVGSP